MKNYFTLILTLITFNMLSQPIWKVSGAPIGDTSVYLYPVGGWITSSSLTLPHPLNEDSIKVFNTTGNPVGVHIYRVNRVPNSICTITGVGGNDRYFGVFVVNGTSPTYDINYYYAGNPGVNVANEPLLTLFNRSTNADTICTAWTNIAPILNTVTNILQKTGLGGVVPFWTEGFQNSCVSNCAATTYTGPNGAWTLTNTGVNGTDANTWYVSGTECGNAATNCGTSCGATDPSLHIGANTTIGGDAGASYLNGGFGFFFPETHKRIESPTINCAGRSNITVSFNYIENGDGINDNAELWYFNGTTWTLLNDLAKTPLTCSPQGTWTAYSINLPTSANNNANVKIGFQWVNNDDLVGTDPSFAVDDIQLTYPSNLRNEFILGTTNPLIPLPVKLISFTGKNKTDYNLLQWTTASEINNDFFTLESSNDALNWKSLANVKGAGNSNTILDYNFLDYNFYSPITYYRLKQTDFDGTSAYSKTIAISNKNNTTYVAIYPNPAHNNLNIRFSDNLAKNTKVEVFNNIGQLIDSYNISENKMNINLKGYPEGMYFIKIVENNKLLIVKKFIKQGFN